MDKSILVKLFGYRAALFHHDTLVLDRWRWITRRLPKTENNERVLDIGCGTGAFSIAASKRGYQCLGLSWDERNQNVATVRAKTCGADNATFDILDVRELDSVEKYKGQFDVAFCMENVEHIINDQKLFHDMAACLKPGGRILLSTPNLLFRSMTADLGPYSTVEDGGHVIRGYNQQMLTELATNSGLRVEEISYCSGFTSQKLTLLMRLLRRIHPAFAWLAILPLRVIPPLFDRLIERVFEYPGYSICLEAYKPRYENHNHSN